MKKLSSTTRRLSLGLTIPQPDSRNARRKKPSQAVDTILISLIAVASFALGFIVGL